MSEQSLTPQRTRGAVDWSGSFLKALEETGVVVKACKAANISRTTVWERKQGDPVFAKLYEESLKSGGLLLEAEAVRRASEGLLRKKFTKSGAPIIDPATGEQYVEHEYSDSLLLALLKRHFPDQYREKQSGDVSVTSVVNNILVMNQDQMKRLQERNQEALMR